MLSGATVTLNGASAAFRGFFIPSTGTISITADPAAASMQMFGLSPSVTSTGNRTVGTTLGANFAPAISPASASTTTWGAMTGFAALPSLTAVAGGGTATLSAFVGASVGATVNAGWTITTAIGFNVGAPTGAGAVTNWYGINIEDPGTFGGTTKVSLLSSGTTTGLRHAGPALFGTTGASNTASGVDVAGDLATRVFALALANGVNDDIAIGNHSFVRITGPTGAFSISSLGTPYDGKIVTLLNTTAFAMTITNAAGTGTAANRIVTSTNANLVGTAGNQTSVTLIYDSTTTRWRDTSFRT
jgi:hypothetical protein